MSSEHLSTSIPGALAAELRATSARTGLPMSRIIAQGLRLRIDQLNAPPLLNEDMRATLDRLSALVGSNDPKKESRQ